MKSFDSYSPSRRRVSATTGGLVVMMLASAACVSACATADEREGAVALESANTSTRIMQKRAIADAIKEEASARGITNTLVIAAVGQAESRLSQCQADFGGACPGPTTPECNGGPILAGGGDGDCALQQGGLGIFQFDAGTFHETIAAYSAAHDITTMRGNVAQGVVTVIDKTRGSRVEGPLATNEEAIAFLNRVKPGTPEFETWAKKMAQAYNGWTERDCSAHCPVPYTDPWRALPGFCRSVCKYKYGMTDLVAELGEEYWASPAAAQQALPPCPEDGLDDIEARMPALEAETSGPVCAAGQLIDRSPGAHVPSHLRYDYVCAIDPLDPGRAPQYRSVLQPPNPDTTMAPACGDADCALVATRDTTRPLRADCTHLDRPATVPAAKLGELHPGLDAGSCFACTSKGWVQMNSWVCAGPASSCEDRKPNVTPGTTPL